MIDRESHDTIINSAVSMMTVPAASAPMTAAVTSSVVIAQGSVVSLNPDRGASGSVRNSSAHKPHSEQSCARVPDKRLGVS